MKSLAQTTPFAAAIGVLLLSVLPGEAQEATPELEPLRRFIGSWEQQVTSNPAEWTPKKTAMTCPVTVKWILRGRMIEHRGVWSPGNIQALCLMAYDPEDRVYRQWYFDSAGSIPRGETRGKWNEATRTFTWTGRWANGTTSTQTHRFIDEDTQEWTLVIKDGAGKACLDMVAKANRRASSQPGASGWSMTIQSAAREGNRKAVKTHLALGVSPNSQHFFTRETPLIESAAEGHADIVRLLIEHGADVNKKGEAWYGPLHVAARGGHLEVVNLLLDHGADVAIFGHDKPLHYAAKNGHIEVAEVLLNSKHGAKIDARGMSEQTPLVTAASNRQVEMVKYLLSKGADVNARANYGRTALYSSYRNDDVETGLILLRHGADVTLEFNGKKIAQSFLDRLRGGKTKP